LKIRIVWFFNELESSGIKLDNIVKINFIDLTKGEHKTEEFKKISPFQSVPAFVTEKGTFYESCSILLSLGSKFQNSLNLVPENKGKYYQWISFACSSGNSTLFNFIVDDSVVSLYFDFLKNESEEVMKPKIEKLKPKLEFISNSLGDNDYLVGNKFSICDIAIGYILAVAGRAELLSDFKNLKEYVGRLASRESFQKAFAPIPSKEILDLQEELKIAKKEKELLKGETSMTLYHYPGSRSSRVLWLLNEFGLKKNVDFKLVDLTDVGWKFMQTDEYKKINPNSLVPAMTFEDENMFEAGTLLIHLQKKFQHKKNFIPKSWTRENWEKHHLYEYWCITTMDGKLVASMFGLGKVSNYLTGGVEKWWLKSVEPVIVKDLGENKYIQGNEFTATDFFLGYTLTFIAHNGILKKSDKKIVDYYERISTRNAFVESMEGSIFQWKFENK
jgi:glutathione S-transferase